jgi:hypothetical protein
LNITIILLKQYDRRENYMAEIDKALPNEPRKTLEIPGDEELQDKLVEAAEEVAEMPSDVEITENEDGSVDIDYDPNAVAPEGGDEHYANLAEFLPDDVLGRMASQLYGN